MRFKPRYSLYIEGETRAEFVVDAALSRWHGQPWPGREKAPDFRFQIRLASGGGVFVAGEMRVGSSGVFAFSLAGLRPSFDPYAVHLAAMAGPGAPNVAAVSELVLLPDKKTGSVTRLDNLNGGLLFRSPATGGRFKPFLPYGFYPRATASSAAGTGWPRSELTATWGSTAWCRSPPSSTRGRRTSSWTRSI